MNDNSPAYGQRIDEHGEAAHPGTLTLWVEGQFEIWLPEPAALLLADNEVVLPQRHQEERRLVELAF